MVVIVPEGLVFNRSHKSLWQYLFQNSRIRLIASLPRGTFAPYTEAGTQIIYLTHKNVEQTEWFYVVTLDQDRDDAIDMDSFQFFYQSQEPPPSTLPSGVKVVTNIDGGAIGNISLKRDWKVSPNVATIPLWKVASIQNGQSITQATAIEGGIPVIAGGRGTIPYWHNESNADGNCFTISKSGAYSGYVWWHHDPIWASDSIIVRSTCEEEFLSFYLYLCLKAKQKEIYDRQQGTGQPHIYAEHIKDFPIPKISINEQNRIIKNARDSMLAVEKATQQAKSFVDNSISDINSIFEGK